MTLPIDIIPINKAGRMLIKSKGGLKDLAKVKFTAVKVGACKYERPLNEQDEKNDGLCFELK
tara:strand:- start:9 stop:194 length:186 start_codon:yes stop_codon:yes gene_type:complete